jgi:predicted RNase H-like nuclease
VSWIAGLDGCRGGWVIARENLASGELRTGVIEEFRALFDRQPRPRVIGVDIPIGLTERGPRPCDREARRRLGPGATSRVFPAPIRALLHASDWAAGNRLSRELDGRGLTRQTFGILPKIREVDAALTPARAKIVFEVHPELSFRAMAGAERGLPSKRSPEGAEQRVTLVRREFPTADLQPPRGAALDDLLDAFAVLWTARRLVKGKARPLPDPAPRDARGLAMAIWT